MGKNVFGEQDWQKELIIDFIEEKDKRVLRKDRGESRGKKVKKWAEYKW